MSEKTQQSIASGITRIATHVANISAASGAEGVDPTSSAISTVTCTETSTEALAAGARSGASFVNTATQDAYILLGEGTASATNYTVKLPAGGEAIYETPFSYSGAVQVVFAAAGTGDLVITKI